PSLSATTVSLAVTQISQPFSAMASAGSSAATPPGGIEWTPLVLMIAWALGVEFVVMQRFRAWRVVRAAIRASSPIRPAMGNLLTNTEIRSSRTVLEPSVVGLWRPILLLPTGIEQRLSSEELDAVIAHEACHVSCRDNL